MEYSNKVKAKSILLFVASSIFVLLLIIALIRNVNGYNHISFSSFLDYLSNSPKVIPLLSISDFTITGSWGLFEFLRNFLNIFTQLFGIIIWFGSSIINIFLYAFYFLRYIFVL